MYFLELKDEEEDPRDARRYGRVRWAPGAAVDASRCVDCGRLDGLMWCPWNG